VTRDASHHHSPTTDALVRQALDAAIEAAERGGGPVTVLDAGCGRVSALRPYRPRIARFVGADIHAPAHPLPHLDEFATVDLCEDTEAFAPGTFDVVLSSFTLEHFADPRAALANLRRWLRPGGHLIATTVNRRHPFVAAYLGLPGPIRRRVQPLVKASSADAHPLVGACNSPSEIDEALRTAGFEAIQIRTTGHLERAWGRHAPTRALGWLGDRLTDGQPARRSTIVASAAAPGGTDWAPGGTGSAPSGASAAPA
jgi:SAM-dependent methyltransferase